MESQETTETEPQVITKGELWSRAVWERRNEGFQVETSQTFRDFCEACRRGDLEQVCSLVENYDVPVNGIDEFDYTPLILASLCGHANVVEYLLKHGAVCQRDTFQGERCLYGALNDHIRNMLLSYDISKAIDDNQPFASHIASLFDNRADSKLAFVSDCMFSTTHADLGCHKFYLAARSTYFANKFAGAWESLREIEFSQEFADELYSVLRLTYLHDHAKLTGKQVENAAKLAKKFKLQHMSEQPYDPEKRRAMRTWRSDEIAQAKLDLDAFYRRAVLANKYKGNGHRTSPTGVYHDAYLQSNTTTYPVHRAILCRSEYYMDLFTGPFSESYQEFPAVTLPYADEVVEIVLQFLYTDKADIAPELALETVYVADMLSLDKERSLKSMAAIVLTKDMDNPPASIFDILRAGWDTGTQRLEHFAAEHIARNLDKLYDDTELATVVLESAQQIRERQETDTVELIDDVRYYLAKHYGIYNEDMNPLIGDDSGFTAEELEYEKHLQQIDQLLEELDLQA
ncbi:substrate adaptors for Cullin 3 ubiquitin ligase Btb3 [Schizosaccharomyces japonicus yFS275]|uniref:Substrate adaptors for Cullin 3 ubiquitin ligase Btb3 n=1 Tax=Schizosaccharomyces japonicus (strain yFS275 / FY16936) TaxID=402676 RepID=B6JZK1_SCHJY|nr:substrate adaptors for Cullin 3 ubiquitin ligase Btb3 [Schizosaccharomyces japonicus yFS275]EEB06969.1 substrate adaptors for Cullin 3 ubiquitin ligase Btb3 [Schizosaccharomyces japonicus yFS275]